MNYIYLIDIFGKGSRTLEVNDRNPFPGELRQA